MAHSLVIHVGPRKTGSTFLQRALAGAAPQLADAGILYPTRLRGLPRYNHVSATYSVPGLRAGRSSEIWSEVDPSIIDDLVAQVVAWDGPVVLSSEALGGMTSHEARQVLDRLPAVPTHIIATIRALPDVALSSWSQHVRNLHVATLDSYLERRMGERDGSAPEDRWARWDADPHSTFWRSYDYACLVDRWQRQELPITAVIVPPSSTDPQVLWSRFRQATGLDGLPEACPTVQESRANRSLGMEELEVLRNTVIEARERGSTAAGMRSLRGHRWKAYLDRSIETSRPGMTPEQAAQFEGWAREDLELMTRRGADVIGDPTELLARARIAQAPDPDAYAAAAGFLVADRVLAAHARRPTLARRLRVWQRRLLRLGQRYSRSVARRVAP